MAMKMYLIFLLAFSALCAKTRTQIAMGTFVSITLDEKQELFEKGFEIFKEVDASLTSYKEGGDVYELNKHHFVKLRSYTYEALALSKHYYKESHGFFDITVGSITKSYYHFGENREFIPYPALLKKANVGFSDLRFNMNFAFIKKGIKVDLGGMGKGFGVQKVSELFLKKGVKKALIAASGDIRCIGVCEVDLQDPFSQNTLFRLKTKKSVTGITTSGNYRRFVASKKCNHLINPYLKQSAQTLASTTLISTQSSADLDAYATAVSVMPLEMAKMFLDSKKIAYIFITNAKEMIISQNIHDYVTLIQTK